MKSLSRWVLVPSFRVRPGVGVFVLLVTGVSGCFSASPPVEQPRATIRVYEAERLAWQGSLPELVERLAPALERRGAELVSVTEERAKYRVRLAGEHAEFELRRRDDGVSFRATGEADERSKHVAWLRVLQCKRALRSAVGAAPAAADPAAADPAAAEPTPAASTPDPTLPQQLPKSP